MIASVRCRGSARFDAACRVASGALLAFCLACSSSKTEGSARPGAGGSGDGAVARGGTAGADAGGDVSQGGAGGGGAGADAAPGTDASKDSSVPPDSGAADAPPDVDRQALCANSITNTAPIIGETDHPNTPMPPSSSATGGSVQSGTYYLTREDYYQGATSFDANQALQVLYVIDSAQRSLVIVTNNSGQLAEQSAGGYVASGSNWTSDMAFCGQAGSRWAFSWRYTYAAGTLTFYSFTDQEVDTYQKQ